MSRRPECALEVRRDAAKPHRQLLIATDLDEASVALPIFDHLDAAAHIVVLGTYRIPCSGLHVLFGAPRLERALAANTHETMRDFVRSSGLASSRFELLTCHDDPHDRVIREARSRRSDLVVLAFSSCSCRVQQRIAIRVLDETECDLVIVQTDRPRPERLEGDALVALGPWPG